MANCLLLLGALDKTREPNRDGPINQGFKKTVAFLRFSQGRSTRTSFLILDAQSVKNTDTAENSGYDGGKKIKGIKRTFIMAPEVAATLVGTAAKLLPATFIAA